MNKMLLGLACVLPIAAAAATSWDHALDEFPALPGEADDTARIQRAIDATPSGVLFVPKGLYKVSSPLVVTNLCSLDMHKSAILRAVSEMPYVLKVNNAIGFRGLPKGDDRLHDYNFFVTGGRIDGNGLASCMALDGFRHYSLRDISFMNGKVCGLRVNGEAGGYELIAFNLYFKCVIPGLAGNAAVWSTGGDSHYTDCVVVDYTIGFRMGRGGSNRLTRCHVWGGPLPATEPGGEREMLKNSVNFWIDGAGDTILRDCYADTGKTGFLVNGWDTHLDGCRYFNNYGFKLDDITVIDHRSGRLLVNACRFNKSNPKIRAYTGIGTVEWKNMIYSNFPADADQPGALDFEVDQDCTTADDWELLPGGKPCVLEAKPNEFAGKPDCRSWRLGVSRKTLARKFPKAGPGKELVVRARATRPDTKAVEITLIHSNGKVWGTQVPLEAEWRDIRVPLSDLHYFKHWGNLPPLEPGDAPDARLLQTIGICYGKWLCQKALDQEHGFEISSIRITGRCQPESNEKLDFREKAKNVDVPPMKKTGKATAADKPLTAAEFMKKMNEGYRIGARNQLATSEEQRCVSLIAQAIKREWNKESFKWYPGLKPLQVSIKLGPGGSVRGFSILAGSGDRDVDRTAQSALGRLKSIPGLSATFLEHFPEIALLMEPTQGE